MRISRWTFELVLGAAASITSFWRGRYRKVERPNANR